jgi:hypothetical protein
VALVGVGSLVLALSAAASAQANLTGSTFEGGDGNLVVSTTGNTDWANAPSRVTGTDKFADKTDDAFGQGTKEDNAAVTIVDGSIPPNKNDLTRFYTANETLATVGASGSTGDIMLYLAWERLVNIGNANLDFEINQAKTSGWTSSTTGPLTINRTAGDLLVTYDFGGSGTPTLGLNTWITSATGTTADCFASNALPCWGKHTDLNGTDSEGAVNTGPVAEPIAGGNLTVGLFGEAAIDLTAAGVFQAGTCKAFGSIFVKSRSSSSFTAELKDFISPQGIDLANCSSSTVTTPKLADGTTTVPTTGVAVGSTVKDSAVVTASPASVIPTGSVAFSICTFALNTTTLCDGTTNVGTSVGTTTISSTNTSNPVTVVSPGYTVTDVGRYCWRAVYSGDATKGIPTSSDSRASECFVANPVAASGTTAQKWLPNDSGTISASAGGNLAGSATFTLYPSGDCTGTSVYSESVPVAGASPQTVSTSNTTVFATGSGSYSWKLAYSSTNANQTGFAATCKEATTLTITNTLP